MTVPDRRVAVALLGAVAALVGDLGQLWTVNAARPALGLPTPPEGTIVWGTLLGVFGIPCYALGYRAACRRLHGRPGAPLAAAAGTVFAVLGGTVHATTGVLIAENARGIAGDTDPLRGILEAGPIVLALWGVAGVALVVAGAALLRAAEGIGARLWNPLVLTVVGVLGAQALPLPWRDFAGPAAVNVAHLLWFLSALLRRP